MTNCPPPKYGTARNPNNPSFGARVAAVATYLGTPLMPWQRRVADVVMELNPRDPGAWRYQQVVISVPRQAGKTALLRAIMADRLMNYARHEVLMTAQTGKDARKRWKQLAEALRAEKKQDIFKTRLSQGSEAVTFLPNGSKIAPFAPTPKSIHGDSLHLVTVDEAWAFDSEKGAALETAINPTQLTVKDSQLIIVSTKGTASSAYLNQLIEKGREAVKDPLASMAYFEWSANEEQANENPYSDETLSFHPAIGYTQSADKIRSLETGSLDAWKRSILNLETATESTILNLAVWDSLSGEVQVPREINQVSLGFDVAQNREGAAIYAAWTDKAKGLQIALVKQAPGVSWLLDDLPALARLGHRDIIADDSGTARTVIGDLDSETRDKISVLKPREYATACQLFLDRVKAGEITHDHNPGLRDAIANAAIRSMGGAVAFDARKSAGAIDTLRAAALAVWGTRLEEAAPLAIYY